MLSSRLAKAATRSTSFHSLLSSSCTLLRAPSACFATNAAATSTDSPAPSIAIVGSGASGLFTAKYLLQELPGAKITILDRLPTPHGLIRYGVAADHPEAKVVTADLDKAVLSHPNVTFVPNVAVTAPPVTTSFPLASNETVTAVPLADLRAQHDAVVLAVGAESSKRLNLPGEDTPGVWDAREFVGWYNGHPDYAHLDFHLDETTDVVILGNGNVALDVARILLKPAAALADTTLAPHAYAALETSAVQRITVAARYVYI